MHIAMLFDDAYGGRGGIAQFNRDLIEACCAAKECAEIVLFQRIGALETPQALPPGARYAVRPPSTPGYGRVVSIRYCLLTLLRVCRGERFDLVICGHLYLLPLAILVATVTRAQLVTVMHGVEAWAPSRHRLADFIARRTSNFLSVSRYTFDRFVAWSGNTASRVFVIPNTVELDRFAQPRDTAPLKASLGLGANHVIFTLGRLSSLERYKGYDEIIEVLPRVQAVFPDVVYVLGGDGDDRARLVAKAARLGVGDAVVFPGYLPEADKPLYYRLADVFLLAGRGEGFGIVLLEALASGCPVIASRLDASAEAVLHGELGALVDPGNPDELAGAIIAALRAGRRSTIPDALAYFGKEAFGRRIQEMLRRFAPTPPAEPVAGSARPDRIGARQ